MTICGYHPRMGAGIAEFGEGLIESLREKANRKGQTISERLELEEDEVTILTAFLGEVLSEQQRDAAARDLVEAFAAVVCLAKFLMNLSAGPPQDEAALALRIRGRVSSLAGMLADYEDAYERARSNSCIGQTREAFAATFGLDETRALDESVTVIKGRRVAT